jgi:hypothetical protein
MAGFHLDAAQVPLVTITIRAADGSVAEHEFEVLILNKQRHDAYLAYAKRARPVQQHLEELEAKGELPSDAEQHEMASLMISGIDERLRSTNGPVTIASLWDDGVLSLAHLRSLGEYLMEEATGSPPA